MRLPAPDVFENAEDGGSIEYCGRTFVVDIKPHRITMYEEGKYTQTYSEMEIDSPEDVAPGLHELADTIMAEGW